MQLTCSLKTCASKKPAKSARTALAFSDSSSGRQSVSRSLSASCSRSGRPFCKHTCLTQSTKVHKATRPQSPRHSQWVGPCTRKRKAFVPSITPARPSPSDRLAGKIEAVRLKPPRAAPSLLPPLDRPAGMRLGLRGRGSGGTAAHWPFLEDHRGRYGLGFLDISKTEGRLSL